MRAKQEENFDLERVKQYTEMKNKKQNEKQYYVGKGKAQIEPY